MQLNAAITAADIAAPGTALVTVSNPGGMALSITGIQATGDFAQTNNCGTSLASLASCTISVTTGPTSSLLIPVIEIVLGVGCFAAMLALPFIGGRKPVLRTSKPQAFGLAVVMLACLIVGGGMVGCGGGGTVVTPPVTTSPTGTYSLQIVASDGTTSQTQTITLVVQ
jgi:hypothetical protein